MEVFPQSSRNSGISILNTCHIREIIILLRKKSVPSINAPYYSSLPNFFETKNDSSSSHLQCFFSHHLLQGFKLKLVKTSIKDSRLVTHFPFLFVFYMNLSLIISLPISKSWGFCLSIYVIFPNDG